MTKVIVFVLGFGTAGYFIYRARAAKAGNTRDAVAYVAVSILLSIITPWACKILDLEEVFK